MRVKEKRYSEWTDGDAFMLLTEQMNGKGEVVSVESERNIIFLDTKAPNKREKEKQKRVRI